MQVFSKDLLMAIQQAGGINQVSCSQSTTWILLANGDLYGCGNGSEGQQGNGQSGSGVKVTSPTKRAENVAKVLCFSNKTFYLTNDGDFYACGANNFGQQGSGDTNNVTTFTKRGSNVKDFVIGSSNTVWYIDNNGDLYGTGYNGQGQQGSGDTSNVLTFTKRASNVIKVAASGQTTWYIDTNGDLYGCGYNHDGQQGSGDTNNVLTFTKRASGAIDVVCSMKTTWYISETNGKLYGCGGGDYGQQGNGSYSDVNTFTLKNPGVTWQAQKILCNQSATWVLTTLNQLLGCGDGAGGQQGNGSTSNVTSFTLKANDVTDFYTDIHAQSSSGTTVWYIDENGDLYGTGLGGQGQQGSNATSNVLSFTKRASDVQSAFVTIYQTYYTDTNGDIYGCGYNAQGQQGNGTTNNQLTFENKMQYLT